MLLLAVVFDELLHVAVEVTPIVAFTVELIVCGGQGVLGVLRVVRVLVLGPRGESICGRLPGRCELVVGTYTGAVDVIRAVTFTLTALFLPFVIIISISVAGDSLLDSIIIMALIAILIVI